jgi:hypothetical protein
MRLTVGTLPPAVYWRRRAVVLGVLLVVVLLFWASCGGPDHSNGNSNKAGDTTSASPKASPSPSATSSLLVPTVGGNSGSASPPASAGAPGLPPANAPAATGNGATGIPKCADSDLSLIAQPETAVAPNGAYDKFFIKIKNITDHPCTRDLGADHQELYLQKGTSKVWSSDVCNPAKGTDTVTMQPNIEHEYNANWNGQASDAGCTNRKPPGIGKYELFARLDTKISEPADVQLT